MGNDNAARFLGSYNRIESHLKMLYNARPTQNFTDLVKRCTELNITVRRYENELIDYGKLRNAIVHNSDGFQHVIAVPCDAVVDHIEFIERHICRPPGIMDAIKIKRIASVFADRPLSTAIDAFAEYEQKTIIVYDHGKMTGVIYSYRLYGEIAKRLNGGENVNKYLSETMCGDLIREEDMARYLLLPRETTVVDVFEAFEKQKHLIAAIITENGELGEKAINIITPADFPRINRFLENYNVKPF